jgi:cell shape-determining protein MreC
LDAIRRVKIEVLIPILETVEDEVHGVFNQEEDALDGTLGNLKETTQSQRSEEAFRALNAAWDHIAEAVEELKKAIGIDQPELPVVTPAKPFNRRI